MKVEVAVLGSPSLISLTVSVQVTLSYLPNPAKRKQKCGWTIMESVKTETVIFRTSRTAHCLTRQRAFVFSDFQICLITHDYP